MCRVTLQRPERCKINESYVTLNKAQDTKTKRLKPPLYTLHIETVQISDFKFCIFMLRICPSQKKFNKILFFMTKNFILKICVLLKKKNDVELMEAFLRYEFGGLTFGGAYFRNFAVFYSNTGLVLDLQWLLYSNIRTMKSIYTVPGNCLLYTSPSPRDA